MIELLVVIALISIMAAFAAPNLSGWNCRQNTEKDFINLASAVTYIKGLAVDRNQTMQLRSQGSGRTRQYFFYESPANSVGKKTACTSNSWTRLQNEKIELKDTLISGPQVTCFHGDGSINRSGYTTAIWRVGKVCDGKSHQYQIQVHGSTGFVDKRKWNYTKKMWVDF